MLRVTLIQGVAAWTEKELIEKGLIIKCFAFYCVLFF